MLILFRVAGLLRRLIRGVTPGKDFRSLLGRGGKEGKEGKIPRALTGMRDVKYADFILFF